MKKGYIFVTNFNKPTKEEAESRSPVIHGSFSKPCVETALEKGYEVYVGINRKNPENIESDLPVHFYDSHVYRSITDAKDCYIAYKNLDRIVKQINCDCIHCNTPIGGLVGRLVGKKNRVRKVIYTAHGFHFYKGAPLLNCTVFKLAERIMAHYTDALITMNKEDYEAAEKFRLKRGGKVYFVHGVGIKLKDYENISACRNEKRAELNLSDDDIAVISAGDLIARKNYKTAIEAIARCENPHIHYFICGKGPELDALRQTANRLGVESQIHFLGFRTDMKELLAASDIFLFSTLQEGLPRSLMEAMASGLPCVVSKIRGNVDLVEDGVNGFLCGADNADAFAEAIEKLTKDRALRQQMSQTNLDKIKEYDESVVKREMETIYREVLS